MSLSRIDGRFLLPRPPSSATVLPGAEEWIHPLERVGVLVSDRPGPDLAVAGADEARRAVATHARALVLEGGPARGLSGYVARRFLAYPSLEQPVLLLPVDRRAVCSYAIDNWTFPSTRARAMRKAVLVPLAAPIVRVLRRPGLTVATRHPGQPFLVAEAAERFGLDTDADWFLVCGQGDELARGVFVLFQRGASEPSWVVKFARSRGYADPFDRDERGHSIVAAAGGTVARRAPRLVGRFVEDGFAASVETAAVGAQLSGVLGSGRSRRAKLRLIESVAVWILRLGLETKGAPGSAAEEVARLRREVIPAWHGVGKALLSGLDALPAVLQHNDLGAWNIVVDRSGEFTAIDWEDANAGGLPLWDLWYFLVDALALVDGGGEVDRLTMFGRLFRGESASSPMLFRLTKVAVESFGIPPEAVGRIATLFWLHHGLSGPLRAEALARHATDAIALEWPFASFPKVWLEDPALGPGWSAWQGSAGSRR